ncbi:hypothetical protein FSOLCH5_008711 [Fusarium solani]|uniref:Alginate lyase 2 n=1 Tax=Fusarium solani TaxID=169388 RepID=A0A9P9G4E6_FUSSL|nr:alginate lyase 2 [Fusarium solani]KAH7232028.1 alginate lyase 2 [Fusarium solani]KAJ3464812.1 hypothetical protein MRS44_009598 [Fusarium solani]
MAPSFVQILSAGLLASSFNIINLSQVAALDPKCAPGGNFDLSHWKLQLPIGSPGKPKTISSADLQGCNGFENFDYFFTNSKDGALAMKVPAKSQCVTTPNSKHCRTELREANPSKWSPFNARNRLYADLVVNQNDDEIVVGQIHIDDSISTKPVMELYYNSKGEFTVGVQKCRTCNQARTGVLAKVPKGQRFHYEIRYEKNKLSVSINDSPYKELDTFDLNGPDSYFKAGNYNQGEGPTNTHFFSIILTH